MVVEARVVTSTEPTHVKWIVVPIMVSIDCYAPANLAGLFLEIACLYCTMNSEVSIVFCRICTAPIRLPGPTLDHVKLSSV